VIFWGSPRVRRNIGEESIERGSYGRYEGWNLVVHLEILTENELIPVF
jgi:hypothetical protein